MFISVSDMMLKEQFRQDLKDALKSGNVQRRLVLSLVMSAIKSRELEKRTKLSKTDKKLDTERLSIDSELTDEEIIATVFSEIKKRKDSIEQFEKGGRKELAQKERDELNILMEYMPEQMSENDVREEVKKAIVSTSISGHKDMGKVIGAVMAKVKGKADGQIVSKITKEELSR